MGLFSKKSSVPSLDTGALTRIAEENAAKQQGIIKGLRGGLQPINTNFETKRGELSARVPGETETTLSRFGQDLSTVGEAETDANRQAGVAFREQSFRNVPEIQRSIRESLGGAGTMGNAAALSALSRPVLDANRASRDFDANLEQTRLGNVTARGEKLADTGFSARSDAMKTKLGLDEGTIDYLTSIGREDLVREAEGLLGTEEQLGSNRLGIEQARQADNMARAAAANSRRSGVLSSLGSVAGAGVGLLGGPMGVALGSQLGGMAGNLAGGGTGGTLDPTLLYAMAQRQPNNRANVVKSLSGGRSTMPGFSPY